LIVVSQYHERRFIETRNSAGPASAKYYTAFDPPPSAFCGLAEEFFLSSPSRTCAFETTHQLFQISSLLNMSSNVGLTTPRGSGTSGYVQRNLSNLRPRDNAAPYSKDVELMKHRQRQPDAEILDHDRKRQIEAKVFEERIKLEDEE
jgi:hypothetical protein